MNRRRIAGARVAHRLGPGSLETAKGEALFVIQVWVPGQDFTSLAWTVSTRGCKPRHLLFPGTPLAPIHFTSLVSAWQSRSTCGEHTATSRHSLAATGALPNSRARRRQFIPPFGVSTVSFSTRALADEARRSEGGRGHAALFPGAISAPASRLF